MRFSVAADPVEALDEEEMMLLLQQTEADIDEAEAEWEETYLEI